MSGRNFVITLTYPPEHLIALLKRTPSNQRPGVR